MTRLSLQEAFALAIRHHQAGELQQAEQIYRQILQQQPNQPDALHLLGVIAHQVRRYDAAVELIGAAIGAGLQTQATYNNLGEAYRMSRMFPQAEECFRRAIQHDAIVAGSHSNLGIVLHELGQFEQAEAEFREALRLDPKFVEAMNNFANLQLARGRIDDAEAILHRALEIRPNYAEAHNNLATALEKRDRYDEAIQQYKRAIEISPNFVEALVNLGSSYQKKNDLQQAISWWQRAIQVRPDHADAHWNIGLATLARGDYQTGWKLYESRFACNHSRQYWREYPQPRWDGSDLNGRTILLYPEQGFGDVIQFARFVPLVASRGGRVILECHAELVEVMKSLAGVAQVVAHGSELPKFDTYLALLSVPSVLGITLENLPADVPYVRATDERRDAWAARISASTGVKKVGIVWSGKQTPDPKRTCPVNELAPLGDLRNVAWFSLQTGDACSELKQLPESFQPIDIGSHLKDFADTAGALANLDLLITIDTAAAHLAGAMAVRTRTMIPFAPDWRWLQDREDSPWYPTMRLFRQPRMNDWTSVVARIRAELDSLSQYSGRG